MTVKIGISGEDLDVKATAVQFRGPVEMNGYWVSGLANPISDQDAATKKYVDDNSGGGDTSYGQTTFQEEGLSSGWQDISSSSVTVSVSSGQKVFIMITCIPYTTQDSVMNVGLAKGSTNLYTAGDTTGPGSQEYVTLQYVDVPGSGSFTYKCRIYSENSGDAVYNGLTTVIVFS